MYQPLDSPRRKSLGWCSTRFWLHSNWIPSTVIYMQVVAVPQLTWKPAQLMPRWSRGAALLPASKKCQFPSTGTWYKRTQGHCWYSCPLISHLSPKRTSKWVTLTGFFFRNSRVHNNHPEFTLNRNFRLELQKMKTV